MRKIQPEHYLMCRVNGVAVYHTLRWCNRITREFWFTTDPNAVDGESRNDKDEHGAMDNHFDSRNLPEQYRAGGVPMEWIQRALLDGFDLDTITSKNIRPEPANQQKSCPHCHGNPSMDSPCDCIPF